MYDVLMDAYDNLDAKRRQAAGVTLGDIAEFASGKPTQQQLIAGLGKGLDTATFGTMSKPIGRFAGGKAMRGLARALPGLGLGLTALDAADIVTNDTSILNKGMDATAMGIGAVLGSVGGPVVALGGAHVGKMASDGLQYLFGDKKTPKQRELEAVLQALNSGRFG